MIESHHIRTAFGSAVKPLWPVAAPKRPALSYADTCFLERQARAKADSSPGITVSKGTRPKQHNRDCLLEILADGKPRPTEYLKDKMAVSHETMGKWRRALLADGLITVTQVNSKSPFITTITDAGRTALKGSA